MTFGKNVERETTLLGYWRQGRTVKMTGLLTGVPVGTISHYFARFNRDKDRYAKTVDGEYQEPPRSSPFQTAVAGLTWTSVAKNVIQMIETNDYARARDYLQCVLLFMDLSKQLQPIMHNYDPRDLGEVMKNLIGIATVLNKPSVSYAPHSYTPPALTERVKVQDLAPPRISPPSTARARVGDLAPPRLPEYVDDVQIKPPYSSKREKES